MGSLLQTPEPTLSDDVRSYGEVHCLLPHLRTAIRLIEQSFDPVLGLTVTLDEDPDVDDRYLVIELATSVASTSEAVDRKMAYTAKWVAAVPSDVIGRIRLFLDLA